MPSRLRRFGFTVAVGLSIVGAFSWYRGHTVAPVLLWAIAASLTICGALVPALLAPVERGWLALAAVLAWVNTRMILSILFFAVFTPFGLVMRLFRDPLDRRLREPRATYWIARPPIAADANVYERQF